MPDIEVATVQRLAKVGSPGRFRSGAFRLAAEAGVPVVPAAIIGSGDVLPSQEHGRVHKARCEVRFGAP